MRWSSTRTTQTWETRDHNYRNHIGHICSLLLEHCPVLVTIVTGYFLAFLSLVDHHLHTLVLIDLLEHLMAAEMLEVPLVKFQHIGNTIQLALGF